MKIGITGGIGSGKSYVCRELNRRGIEVYDCDRAAKRLMQTSEEIRRKLTELIGPDTYQKVDVTETAGVIPSPAFRLNKASVASFLLASEENAHAVDDIVHPAVFQDFEESGMEWMESAIIYESGIYRLVDRVIVVTAPLEVRLQRIMERDGITREKALEWVNKQWPQDEVCSRADYEIINDGLTPIAPQLDRLLPLLTDLESNKTHKNKKKMQQTILAISGKPGLYKLVSRAKNSLIVEALDGTHRRQPAFATDRITSLADIAMFTETDDVPLMKVLESMKSLEEGKKASIDPKKASNDDLREYFAKVLPEFDRERVHNSDIKKLIQWYNILVEAGITDFEEEMSPTEGDNIDDRKEKE